MTPAPKNTAAAMAPDEKARETAEASTLQKSSSSPHDRHSASVTGNDQGKSTAATLKTDEVAADANIGLAPTQTTEDNDTQLTGDEAPPLPNEAPPDDDGWEYDWDHNRQAWLFSNRITGKKQYENPRVPNPETTHDSSAADVSRSAPGMSPGASYSYDGSGTTLAASYGVNVATSANMSDSYRAPGTSASMSYNYGPTVTSPGASYGYDAPGTSASMSYNYGPAVTSSGASYGYGPPGTSASMSYNYGSAVTSSSVSYGYGAPGTSASMSYNYGPAVTSPGASYGYGHGAPGTSASMSNTYGAPGTSPPRKRILGGYNPAIHGSYDPNADYALEAQREEEEEAEAAAATAAAAAAAGLSAPNTQYGATAHFNRFTGKFQNSAISPENHNDYNKSKRQMSAFFDVDAAANNHDGRSLKAERRNQKLSKAEVKKFKNQKQQKKEAKHRAWLMD